MRILLILFIALFVILTTKTIVMYLRLLRENKLPINSNLIIGGIYIGFRFTLIFIFGFVRCILFTIISLLTLIAGDEEIGQYSFKDCKKDWKGYIYFVVNSLKE